MCRKAIGVDDLFATPKAVRENGSNGTSRHHAPRAPPPLRFALQVVEELSAARRFRMCRNIKTLFNFDPPVTDAEIRAASLQFVRKISGFHTPSQANAEAFDAAVEAVARISGRLLRTLQSNARPKNREDEAAKARARAAQRFGATRSPSPAAPR
jgi:hypothetical protein